MSQLNLSSPDLRSAFLLVLNGDPSTSWVLYTFQPSTSSLTLQSTGSGGLSDLADEFHSSRIQYAFIRLTDPNSGLPKYVAVNWCGDGVLEGKKGLVHTHKEVVNGVLMEGKAHVVISARNEGDVEEGVVMDKLERGGGAKYGFQDAQRGKPPPSQSYTGSTALPKKVLPTTAPKPASYASSYTRPAPAAKPVPAPPLATRPMFGSPNANSQPSLGARPAFGTPSYVPSRASASSFQAAAPAQPPVKTPFAQAQSPASTYSPPPVVSNTPTKPSEEDRIAPVGTAYTPVSLPKPKKLLNPFERKQEEVSTGTVPFGVHFLLDLEITELI